MKERILGWWKDHGERFWLFLGVVLVGALCFEAGMLQGKMVKKEPLVLTVPAVIENAAPGAEIVPTRAPLALQTSLTAGMEPVAAVQQTKQCVFVGSRNSNKYHLATCAVAKRIKPENRVCFSSKEEAEKRGYVPSCLK